MKVLSLFWPALFCLVGVGCDVLPAVDLPADLDGGPAEVFTTESGWLARRHGDGWIAWGGGEVYLWTSAGGLTRYVAADPKSFDAWLPGEWVPAESDDPEVAEMICLQNKLNELGDEKRRAYDKKYCIRTTPWNCTETITVVGQPIGGGGACLYTETVSCVAVFTCVHTCFGLSIWSSTHTGTWGNVNSATLPEVGGACPSLPPGGTFPPWNPPI